MKLEQIDSDVVDQWVKVSDKDTMLMARRIVKEEGLLCGNSFYCIK